MIFIIFLIQVVDIWTGVCTMFVFLVFTTCVVSNWLGPGDKVTITNRIAKLSPSSSSSGA